MKDKTSVAAHSKRDQCSEALNATAGRRGELRSNVPTRFSKWTQLANHLGRALALPAR
jgi:hypothetical protein